jgi:hypothetical protein
MLGNFSQTNTSRSASGYGSGARMTEYTMLKIAAFAPTAKRNHRNAGER